MVTFVDLLFLRRRHLLFRRRGIRTIQDRIIVLRAVRDDFLVIEVLVQHRITGALFWIWFRLGLLRLNDDASEALLLLRELEAGQLAQAEFILELLLVQEEWQRNVILLRFALEYVAKDDSLDAWALGRILVEHLLKKQDKVLGHVVWVLCDFVVKDLVLKLVHFGRRKGVAQAAKFVENDAEGPNVRSWTVLWVLPELGREVERRAHTRRLQVFFSGLLVHNLLILGIVGIASRCSRIFRASIRWIAGGVLGLQAQLLRKKRLLLALVKNHEIICQERRIKHVVIEWRTIRRCLRK